MALSKRTRIIRRSILRATVAAYFAELLESRRLLALTGDFVADQRYTAADIDALAAQIRLGTNAISFDLNSDSLVNKADERFLVEQIIGTKFGDTDLDGDVDATDSARIQANFGQTNVGWSQGDLDANNKIDFGDLSLLAPNNGQTVIGGPALANNAARLSLGLTDVNGAIDDWARLFNLTPIAGKTLPGVDDALADVVGLVNATLNTAPTFNNPSGVVSTLQSRLAALGFSLITLPTAAGQSDITVRLLKNFTALTGTREFDDGTNPLLSGLSSALNLNGSITHSVDFAVSLMLGVDSSGFYLRGDSTLTATVRGDGVVSGSYTLPVLSLGLNLTGTLDADYQISFAAGASSARIRSGQFLTNAWTRTQSGQGVVDLGITLTRSGVPTSLTFGGNWSIAVTSAGVGAINGGVAAPTANELICSLLPLVSDGLDAFLPASLGDALNSLHLPMVDGQPKPVVNPQLDRVPEKSLFDQFAAWLRGIGDFRNTSPKQGAFPTAADKILNALQLRQNTGASGLGVKIGVISDGTRGASRAASKGDLPPLFNATQAQESFLKINLAEPRHGSEGTAMLEIIHDIAPKAKLYFSGYADKADPLSAIMRGVDWMLAEGVDIIVDDLNDPTATTYFADNSVAQRYTELARAAAQGSGRDVLLVSSAGNMHNEYFESTFSPSPVEMTHPDGSTSTVHQFRTVAGGAVRTSVDLVLDQNNALFYLQWDDPFDAAVSQLEVVRIDRANGNAIIPIDDEPAVSTKPNAPFRQYFISAKKGDVVSLAVRVKPGAAAVPNLRFGLEFISGFAELPRTGDSNHPLGDYGLSEGAVYGHKGVEEILTVGALDETDHTSAAGYSNRGPSIQRDADGLLSTRQTPDVMGIEGSKVGGYGGFDAVFYGTSGTAPQAAAVAALLWQLYKTTPGVSLSVNIRDALQDGAVKLHTGSAEWSPATGNGRLDAVASLQVLVDQFGVPSGSGSRTDPDEGLCGLDLLAARGFQIQSSLSQLDVSSLLAGIAPTGDLFRARFLLDSSADMDPIIARFDFDGAGLGAINGFSVNGAVTATLIPTADITLGIDGSGFYLDRTSRIGGALTLDGSLTARVGDSFDVALHPVISMAPTVGFGTIGTGVKLRTGDLVNVQNLSLSLGTISASLTADLSLTQLDYVDNNPAVPNGIHGGDPFVFRATAGLSATQQTGWDFTYTFTPIDIQNPNFNGGTYTYANFLTNLYRYGQDKLAGSGYLGQILDALNQVVQPLSNQFKIGDEINEDLIQLVLNASNVQILVPTSDLQFFNGLESWLQSDGTNNFDLIKARATITNLDLVEVLTVGGDLGQLLRNGSQPINLSNALLNGQLDFGIDTSGGLFVERGGTNLTVGIQVDANLSSQKLIGPSGDLLGLDSGWNLRTTTTSHVTLAGSGRLRLRDFLAPISNVTTSLDNIVVTLNTPGAPNNPGADLLPRASSGGFSGRVENVSGTAVFNANLLDQLTLNVGSARFNLFNNDFRLQSGAATLIWDPQGLSTQTLLSIASITGSFPNRTNWPTLSFSNLAMTGQQITIGAASVSAANFTSGIIEVRNPTFSLSGLTIPFTSTQVSVNGGVTVGPSDIALFPNTTTPSLDGVATANGATLTLNNSGLRFTANQANFAIGTLVTATATGSPITFNPDATGSARVFEVANVQVDLPALKIDNRTPRLTFSQNGATPAVGLRGDGKWDVGTVGIGFVGGGTATFGLGGFVPFEVGSLRLAFDSQIGGGVNFNAFSLFVSGDVDTSALNAILAPLFGQNVAASVNIQSAALSAGGPESVVELRIRVDSLTGGKIGLFVNRVDLGIANAKIGILDFTGSLGIVFDPVTGIPTSVSGGLGFVVGGASKVDEISNAEAGTYDENQQGGASSISGIELNDASLNFTGTITNGTNFALAIDSSVGVRFKLADFFELYGVRFGFDLDILSDSPGNLFNARINSASSGLRSMAVRKVRVKLGDFLEVTGGTNHVDAGTLNFTGSGNIATFGPIVATLPQIRGSTGPALSGSISGLAITQQGLPNLLPFPGVSSTATIGISGLGQFFSDQDNAIFSWLPITLNSLSVQFQAQPFNDLNHDGIRQSNEPFIDQNGNGRFDESIFEIDTAGNVIGPGNPAAFDLGVTGSIGGTIDLPGNNDPSLPFSAGVDGLVLDMLALYQLATTGSTTREIIKSIDGIHGSVSPFDLFPAAQNENNPFSIGGSFGIGRVGSGANQSYYIYVSGDFRFQDFGGSITLALSDRGPLFAKLSVPLAIPLGPTPFVLSGARGAIQWGIGDITSPPSPQAMLDSPPVVPTQFSSSDIPTLVTQTLNQLSPGEFTWDQGVAMGLGGTLTLASVPEGLTGEVDLAINIGKPKGNTSPFGIGAQIYGTGSINALGFPLGRAGILFDYSNAVEPAILMAMRAPAPDNPLGFLMPANAEFSFNLQTKGVLLAPAVALNHFVNGLATTTLDSIRARLESDRTDGSPDRRLTISVLDTNGDNALSVAERNIQITTTLLKSRMLALLPGSLSNAAPLGVTQLTLAGRALNGFIQEFVAINAANPSAVTGFFGSLATLAQGAGLAAIDQFDPTLAISGKIQPVVFGFPMGDALAEATISVNKNAVSFNVNANITALMRKIAGLVNPGFEVLAQMLSLGLDVRGDFGFTRDLSDVWAPIVNGLLGADPDPGSTANDLSGYLVELINPFDDWIVNFSGQVELLGFPLGRVSGLFFGPESQITPQAIADIRSRFVLADPFDQVASANVFDDFTKIPVSSLARVDEMLDTGGLILTGQLLAPAIIQNPVALINAIDNEIPEGWDVSLLGTDLGKWQTWLNAVVGRLTDSDEVARVQMFIPSPALLFDMDNFTGAGGGTPSYLANYSSDQSVSGAPGETFTDSNGNNRWDKGEAFVDLGNAVHDANEPFTDANGNGVYDGPEPFVDGSNGQLKNGRFDAGEDFDDLDRNGVYTTFVNAQGQTVPGEPFVDQGNGVFDGATPGSPARLTRLTGTAAVNAALAEMGQAFFIEGYTDPKLFGLELGRGLLSVDLNSGLKFEVRANWLGLNVTFNAGVGFQNQDFSSMLDDLLSSPLIQPLIGGTNLNTVRTFLAANASSLPRFIAFPTAFAELTLDSSGLTQFLGGVLRLPGGIVNSAALPGGSFSLGFYTPGFAAPGANVPAVKVYGGVTSSAAINLPGLLEGAQASFEMTFPKFNASGGLFTLGGLLSGAVDAFPDFSLRATATRFAASLAGTGQTLIKITGATPTDAFGFSASKHGTLFTANLGGLDGASFNRIEVLPGAAVGTFVLTVSGSMTADLSSNPSFAATLNLGLASGSSSSFALSGGAFSLPAATATFKLLIDSDGPKPVILQMNGSYRAGGLLVSGAMDLSFDSTNNALAADANVTVRATAGTGTNAPELISLNGAAGIRIAPGGFAARGNLSFAGGANAVLGLNFGFASNALFEVNTFAGAQTIGGGVIAAGARRVAFDTSLQLGPFTFTKDPSSLVFGASITVGSSTASVVMTAATQSLPVFGTFSFSGTLTVSPTGFSTNLALTRVADPAELVSIGGSFNLAVNTLGATDTFAISSSNASVSVLGLSLGLPSVSITGVLQPVPLFTLTVTDTNETENPLSGLPISFPTMTLSYRVLMDSAGQFRIDGGTNGQYATATFSGWGIGDANIARLSLNSVGLQVVRQAGSSVIRGRLKGAGTLALPVVGESYSLTSWLSFGDDFNFAAEATRASPTTGDFSIYVDLERDVFTQLIDGSIWSRSNIAQNWGEMTALDAGTQQAEPKRVDISSSFVVGGTWTNDSPDLGKYTFVGGQQRIEIPEQNDNLTLRATALTGTQSITVSYSITFPSGALINMANRADFASALTGSFVLNATTPTRNLATILDDRYFEFNEKALITFTYSVSGFTLDSLIKPTNSIDYTIINADPELDRSLAYWEFDTGVNASGGFTRTPTFVGSPDIEVSDWKHTSENAFTASPGLPGAPGGPRSLDFESTETDYVDIGTSGPSFSATDVITVEAWVRPESVSGIDRFLVVGPVELYVNGGTGQFGVTITPASGADFVGEFGTVTVGAWTHIAVTFNNGAVAAYFNGTPITATAAFTQLSSLDRVIFGTDNIAGPTTNFFDGQLDEVRVWNVARTSTQISTSRTQAINPFTTGLVGCWQFDQNSDVEAIYDVRGTYAPAVPGDGELHQPVVSTLAQTITYVGTVPSASGTNGGLPQIQPETVPVGADTDAVTNARWGSNGNRTRLYFPFDTTGSTVSDLSPFNTDGSLNSPPAEQLQYIGGVHGKALKFQPAPQGVKDWFNPMSVPLNAKSTIQTADDFSVAFWGKTADFSPATSADEVVFFSYRQGGNFTMTIATDEAVGGLVVNYDFAGNTEYTVPLSDLANNSWHHFYIEVDGGSGSLGILRVWVDGVIRSDSGIAATSPILPTVSQITLGGVFTDASGTPRNVVNGAMDDFAVLQGTRQASSEFNTADVLNMMDYGVAWAMQPLNGYQFKVNFTPTANANERLRIDALRFFDFADAAGGPTEWLLTVTDASNVNTVYARIHGTTTVGEWGGQYAELRNHVFSLRGPLLFTLYGIGGTSGNWRIENVNLEGAVLNANQSPPIQANDDRIDARGNGATTINVLSNDSINGTTSIDPNSILIGLPMGVAATVIGGTSIRFTVDSTYAGEFELPYIIRDASGNESGAVVRVHVADLPTTISEKTNMTSGQTKSIPVLVNDYDGAGGGLVLSIVTTGGVPVIPANVGTLSVQGNQLRFVASASAPAGTYRYTYRIVDIYSREAIESTSEINITAALRSPGMAEISDFEVLPAMARAGGDATRVSARPVIVAAPSATSASTLPTSISSIPAGQDFFVEIWVQDLIDHVGISGGSLDVAYTTAFANATAMFRPEYSFAPVGSINDASGLVDDFGGGTLAGGLGVSPTFTRLGYIQFTATSAGTMNVSLLAGAFEFALFGVGDVPFTDVALANTASITITGSSAIAAPSLAAGQDTGISSSDNITRLNQPMLTGTAGTSGQTIQLLANGNMVGSATVGAGGVYNVQPTAALADGLYSFAVRIGTSTGTPLSVTIDTVAPSASTPVWNINLSPHQVALSFTEVLGGTFTLADVTVQNLTTASAVPTAAMSLPTSLTTAYTLSFPGLANSRLAEGRYQLSVPSAGVTDVAGNTLSTPIAFGFSFLRGDTNNDGTVGFDDLLTLAQNYNQAGRSFSQGNFDYSADGLVNFDDLLLLAQNYGRVLSIGSTTSTGSNTSIRRVGLDDAEAVL